MKKTVVQATLIWYDGVKWAKKFIDILLDEIDSLNRVEANDGNGEWFVVQTKKASTFYIDSNFVTKTIEVF